MTAEPRTCAFCDRPARPVEALLNDDDATRGDGIGRAYRLCTMHTVTLAEAGVHGWLAPSGVRYWLVR